MQYVVRAPTSSLYQPFGKLWKTVGVHGECAGGGGTWAFGVGGGGGCDVAVVVPVGGSDVGPVGPWKWLMCVVMLAAVGGFIMWIFGCVTKLFGSMDDTRTLHRLIAGAQASSYGECCSNASMKASYMPSRP